MHISIGEQILRTGRRTVGVDVLTGEDRTQALAGVYTVVDCLNKCPGLGGPQGVRLVSKGEAAHEETYAWSGLPTTIVETTARFTLAEQFLNQLCIGPIAFVPSILLQPVPPDAATDALAEAVETPLQGDEVRLWGPEPIRADVKTRELAPATWRTTRVVGVPFPNSQFRNGALLPQRDGTRMNVGTPTGCESNALSPGLSWRGWVSSAG